MAKRKAGMDWRRGWGALLWLAFVACGETASVVNGSETHFLAQCVESCGDGFDCLGGLCTRPCEVNAECSDLSEAATCAEPDEGCRVPCDTDAECTGEDPDWTCDEGQCRSTKPPVDQAECPLFDGGVQEPEPRDTGSSAIAAPENVEQAVADEDGLFWREESGAVRGLSDLDGESVELRPALDDELRAPMGMLTDSSRVYFAEAGPPWPGPPEEPGPPAPPGRLYAAPKAGGVPELLLELDDAILTLLAVVDGEVVIRSGEFLYLVSDGELDRLDHIPAIPESFDLAIDEGRVYWSDWPSVREPTELWAVELSGGEPEVIHEIDGSFTVAAGRVLWTTPDSLEQVEKLTMLELATGCVTELPSFGELMGTQVSDQDHVYWRSFSAEPSSDACEEVLPFLRVNLQTGAFERLSAGFDVTLCTDFMAQDARRLYVRTWPYHSLVVIDKPD